EYPGDEGGAPVNRPVGDVGAVEPDAAGRRTHRAGDRVEQRALAGAVGADHDGEAAVRQRQIEVVERYPLVRRLRVEDDAQSLDRQHRGDCAVAALTRRRSCSSAATPAT